MQLTQIYKWLLNFGQNFVRQTTTYRQELYGASWRGLLNVSVLYSAVSAGPLQISNPAGASPPLPCQKLIIHCPLAKAISLAKPKHFNHYLEPFSEDKSKDAENALLHNP